MSYGLNIENLNQKGDYKMEITFAEVMWILIYKLRFLIIAITIITIPAIMYEHNLIVLDKKGWMLNVKKRK